MDKGAIEDVTEINDDGTQPPAFSAFKDMDIQKEQRSRNRTKQY